MTKMAENDLKFVDAIDDNTLTVAFYDDGGMYITAEEEGEDKFVSVILDAGDSRVIYDELGKRLEGTQPVEEPVAVSVNTKPDIVTLTQSILDIASAYKLTNSGAYILVDNNALRFIDEVKKVLEEAL